MRGRQHTQCTYQIASQALYERLAEFINKSFQQHQELDFKIATLIPLPKPQKTRNPPANLRPIILLNSTRKLLFLITLERIKPLIDKYTERTQCANKSGKAQATLFSTKDCYSA